LAVISEEEFGADDDAEAAEPQVAQLAATAPAQPPSKPLEPVREPVPILAPELAKAASTPRTLEPATLAIAELLPMVESSGMKLAQTDPEKLAAAEARVASQPAPARAGRERTRLPPVEEAPLTQVETRGDH
jgi:ribonuclease E